MDLRALFAAPEPVPFSAHTTLSRGDVLDRLGRSIGFHYRTDDPVIPFVVLRGSTADGHVDLIAVPYLTPDLRAKNRPPIALKAEVVSTADGSDIRGTATAPVHGATPAFLALLLGGWVLLGVSGGIVTGTFVVVVGPLVAIAWTLIIRHNQRMALGHLDQLVETLESIVSEP